MVYKEKSFEEVKAHGVESFSSSWVLFQEASIQDIMEAASWKSENMFTFFYMREMCRKAPFGGAVRASASCRCVAPVLKKFEWMT